MRLSDLIDRATEPWAPKWTLRRIRARAAAAVFARHYEAAAGGRRTSGWNRRGGDPNAANAGALGKLRDSARDLARNNAYAGSALATIADHTVGWGILAKPNPRPAKGSREAAAYQRWNAWAGTTACDADGRLDLAGLQKQVIRTVAEAGEVLIRRRWRRPSDGLPIPMQLQVLEPDYLDESKSQITENSNGSTSQGQIVQGVEFDPLGRRTRYWLFPQHPGAFLLGGLGAVSGASTPVPAADMLHVFRPDRAGQVRGASWFANVMLRLKDFDDYEDAALMKQKIAACLSVITTDVDGTAPALGATDPNEPLVDRLAPGLIANVPPGRTVTVVQPPTIREHADYAPTVLRAIASGIGVTYEDLTGDYAGMPFSAARMSRLRHWARVEDWRWRLLIPQFCDPVWRWAMEALAVANLIDLPAPAADWTAPPPPMLEPDAEGLAYQRLVRIGAMSWPEMIRERGEDPETVLAEIQEFNRRVDAAGVILDSDPRRTTQAGVPRDAARPDYGPFEERVDALGALIRAGFEPAASLRALNLPAIAHTGILPVTVQPEVKPAPLGSPNGNGNGNGNEPADAGANGDRASRHGHYAGVPAIAAADVDRVRGELAEPPTPPASGDGETSGA